MHLVSEAERRVDRGRQIVARQRDIVAKMGDKLPAALELLEVFEKTLALLEQTFAARHRHEVSGNACVEQAVPALSDREDRTREVARLMEILREDGYHCELAQETLH